MIMTGHTVLHESYPTKRQKRSGVRSLCPARNSADRRARPKDTDGPAYDDLGSSRAIRKPLSRIPFSCLRCAALGVSGNDLRLLYVQYLAHDDAQNFNFLFRLR
jgi:hypothetical protein